MISPARISRKQGILRRLKGTRETPNQPKWSITAEINELSGHENASHKGNAQDTDAITGDAREKSRKIRHCIDTRESPVIFSFSLVVTFI